METFTIGKVAEQTQVNAQTIRYYERQGLLETPPRTEGGFRLYTAETVQRIHFIRRAKELGFTLREIRELLALKVNPDRHCAEVCAKAEEKIAEVDQKIEELTRIRDVLTGLLSDCAKRRSGVAECAVLEGIEREPPPG